MRFTLAQMQEMHQCFGKEWEQRAAPTGYSVWKDVNGRLVVTYKDPDRFYAVRPIIRVPATGRLDDPRVTYGENDTIGKKMLRAALGGTAGTTV